MLNAFNANVFYFYIPTIMCPHCCTDIISKVKQIVGVWQVEVDQESKIATLHTNNKEVTAAKIISHIKEATARKHDAQAVTHEQITELKKIIPPKSQACKA